MTSIQNAIHINDVDNVVDLTEDRPNKRSKLDNNSLHSKQLPSKEFIPFYLYNTKQSMGSLQYATRPPSVQKYFRTLRETIGFDGSFSERRKFQWFVICNYLFDVHYFLQQTLPDILSFKRVVVFYGEGVDTQGIAYWNELLKGSGNTVEFVRLIPSDPPRSKTNPLDTKIPYGVHHTKMFLVGYDECVQQSSDCQSKVRVVVHTANMIQQDVEWKTQGLYSQDFPLKSNMEDEMQQTIQNPYALVASKERGWPFEDDDPQPFEDDLVAYLASYRYNTRQCWCNDSQSQRVLSNKALSLVNLIRQYDFSSAYAVLIPSVPGKHSISNAKDYGYLKLQRAIKEQIIEHQSHNSSANIDCKSSARQTKSPVICQFSSIGSLSSKWLNDFISAIDIRATPEPNTKQKVNISLEDKMNIIWPTVEEIRTSIEGYQGGGSLPARMNNVNKDFLRPLYHRWSKAGNEYNNNSDLLKMAKHVPHIKTFLQVLNPTDGTSPSIEWLCLTSHNLSKAAWGELQNSTGSTTKVFFIRHWELGVFISPATLAKNLNGAVEDCQCHRLRIYPCTDCFVRNEPINIDVDDDVEKETVDITVPLPFDAINPEKYGNGDVPWTVDGVDKTLPDAFGISDGP